MQFFSNDEREYCCRVLRESKTQRHHSPRSRDQTKPARNRVCTCASRRRMQPPPTAAMRICQATVLCEKTVRFGRTRSREMLKKKIPPQLHKSQVRSPPPAAVARRPWIRRSRKCSRVFVVPQPIKPALDIIRLDQPVTCQLATTGTVRPRIGHENAISAIHEHLAVTDHSHSVVA